MAFNRKGAVSDCGYPDILAGSVRYREKRTAVVVQAGASEKSHSAQHRADKAPICCLHTASSTGNTQRVLVILGSYLIKGRGTSACKVRIRYELLTGGRKWVLILAHVMIMRGLN